MKRITRQNLNKEFRQRRNRAKISGTATKPRLSVFRSNRYTYAQLIDDEKSMTLVAASTHELKKKATKVIQAQMLGELLGEKAVKAGITSAVFNKGPYLYHGRVKSVAEGARAKGLKL